MKYELYKHNPDSGGVVWGVDLRPLAYWDSSFESCRGHE